MSWIDIAENVQTVRENDERCMFFSNKKGIANQKDRKGGRRGPVVDVGEDDEKGRLPASRPKESLTHVCRVGPPLTSSARRSRRPARPDDPRGGGRASLRRILD